MRRTSILVFCTEPESQGRHTFTASNGKAEQGYVWCAHGVWSSEKLAKRMHEVYPDMPRGNFGPQAGRA